MTSISEALGRARPRTLVVGSVAAVAAVVAGLAGAHPTGTRVADVVWSAVLAGAVTFATAKARRRNWLFLVGVALVSSSGWMLLPAGLSVVGAVFGTAGGRRSNVLGAVVGATAANVLLRSNLGGFHGASALVTALAVAPVLLSGYAESRTVARRRIRLGLKVTAGLGLLSLVGLGIALALSASDVSSGIAGSRSALRSTREGDTSRASADLRSSLSQLRRADGLLNGVLAAPARAVPVVGQHARALGLFVHDGSTLVRTASRSVDAVDYERLRYRSGRLDLARIRAAAGPLADAAGAAAQADHDLSTIDASWLVAPAQERIDSYRLEVRQASEDATLAAQAAKVAPGLLGGDGPRHYFIAFVTPAELRGSGGFIGSYGELTADAGRVRLTRSGPIGDLVRAAPTGTRRLTGPPDYLARYGPFAPADHFQDLTFSPDFPSDAQAIEQLYPQSGGTEVDGVLQVDPYGLAALLRLTGPVRVDGLDERLTATNAARILLRDQYALFGEQDDQEHALSAAAKATFDALTIGSLPSPRRISAVLNPVVDQGRFKFHSIRPAEQRFMERIGLSWGLPAPSGADLLAVTTQNNGNSKIDVFQHRTIDYAVDIDHRTGALSARAEVAVENRAPTGGLPDVVLRNGQGLPVGTSRVWLSVYTPLTLRQASVGGLRLALKREREGGYNVYGSFFNIPPGTTLRVVFEFGGRTMTPDRYRLVLFPQPTVNPDRLHVTVDGGARATAGGGLRSGGNTASGRFTGDVERTLTSSFGP